ncbi:Geranylgeranyl transferase type-1 subunit beta [Symbiodinium microadriaticum]|uniref:Geranylgeranyl transferase type-1 subunit beta n=1 Tax=Symbiodinium microadriaticum TaxID=2951 RepID=A0A1Q9E024_SYMMI|nr:Geranylgeranyl transferase type-1 subunit beta [Symbiodinium microadriaticum]CAE7336438.1 PGGT1B [Symbiodinium microadriaticum]CAE7375558.1 PGGT1B [Symbiodinium sp. KB8]
MAADSRLSLKDFDCAKHVAYFKQHAKKLPEPYKTMDTNRLTLLYFSVSGLDLLGKLDELDREQTIEYIYSYQSPLPDHGGFYGCPRVDFQSAETDKCNNQPHIANTYVALVMLIILGDDLRRVNRSSIGHSLRKWQLDDGSFCCVHCISSLDSESDIRFVYCAAAICYILDLWHAIDVEAMTRFIYASQSYDGAFGMGPGAESHGGCTYCAVAALRMLGRLADLPSKDLLVDWCVRRQVSGFQGRIEKDPDSCYSFWVGGSMQLLGAHFLQPDDCLQFLKRCESQRLGGFQKFPDAPFPDLLHSYFSVCGLSLCRLLPPLHALLGVSQRAADTVNCTMAPGGTPWLLPSGEGAATPAAAAERNHKSSRRWFRQAVLGVSVLCLSVLVAYVRSHLQSKKTG